METQTDQRGEVLRTYERWCHVASLSFNSPTIPSQIGLIQDLVFPTPGDRQTVKKRDEMMITLIKPICPKFLQSRGWVIVSITYTMSGQSNHYIAHDALW